MKGAAIIVGGGLGGLTAAIALRKVGWSVTVLERSLNAQVGGAGLSLAPNAMRALHAIGLGEAVRSIGMPTAATSIIRRSDGSHLVHVRQPPERLPLLAVQRSLLQQVLLTALSADFVIHGAEMLTLMRTIMV